MIQVYYMERRKRPCLVQYTYNWKDKIILMGGIRADHSDIYGTFVTPRAHIKYAPDDWVNLRVSVG